MKYILIDIEKCYECKKCLVDCSYYDEKKRGQIGLLEHAVHAFICRKCEQAPCVLACPQDALEKDDSGILTRYSMRCTSCKTCTLACPFGTMFPEIVPYIRSICDNCDDLEKGKEPTCISSCPEKALQTINKKDLKADDITLIGENLAVRYKPWKKN